MTTPEKYFNGSVSVCVVSLRASVRRKDAASRLPSIVSVHPPEFRHAHHNILIANRGAHADEDIAKFFARRCADIEAESDA